MLTIKLGKERRRFLGSSLGKVAEYLFTAAIVAKVVSGNFNLRFVILAFGFAMLLLSFAVWVIPPDDSERR